MAFTEVWLVKCVFLFCAISLTLSLPLIPPSSCVSILSSSPLPSLPSGFPSPSFWISTSASLQADYEGFNVPFNSSMFWVVRVWRLGISGYPFHRIVLATHWLTHTNTATLAFIKPAVPVRLAHPWAAFSLFFDGRLQTAVSNSRNGKWEPNQERDKT